MKLNRISDTATELHFQGLPDGSVDLVVLFSYQTPVAARLANGDMIKTNYKHSVTTSRHISQFVQGVAHNPDVREVSQIELDRLMDGGETTPERYAAIGAYASSLLGLRKNKGTGRYTTQEGDKTDEGLGRTLARIVQGSSHD